MALIAWSDQLSVRITSIDEQHKRLVGYINALHDGMTAGNGDEILGAILEDLVAYTKNHFAFEERLFADHKYNDEDSDSHKNEHKKLSEQVFSFYNAYKRGHAVLTMDLMNFLTSWLTHHIMVTDKKYVPYLTSKGVK